MYHRGWLGGLAALALLAAGCGGGGSSNPAPNQWRIGPSGGTFQTTDGKARLTVSTGGVADTKTVTWQALTSAPNPPAGMVYANGSGFSFSTTIFSQPSTLTLTIPAGVPTAGATIYRRADGGTEWQPLTTTVDATERTATATVTSFSSFAIFYPPTFTGSAYWIEERRPPTQTDLHLDVYGAPVGGPETLIDTAPLNQPFGFLRSDTFRFSDRSFLSIESTEAGRRVVSFSLATDTKTTLGPIPITTGWTLDGANVIRNRIPNSVDYVAQFGERNAAAGTARDRLMLFRNGSQTPTILMSIDRADGENPARMRPWDVSADGRVLVLTSEGLTLMSETSTNVIAPAEVGPAEAYFSPDGTRVLFVQRSDPGVGWKVHNIATNTTQSIPGLPQTSHVRWANDTHVAVVSPIGVRNVSFANVGTGDSIPVVSASIRQLSLIRDVGAQ